MKIDNIINKTKSFDKFKNLLALSASTIIFLSPMAIAINMSSDIPFENNITLVAGTLVQLLLFFTKLVVLVDDKERMFSLSPKIKELFNHSGLSKIKAYAKDLIQKDKTNTLHVADEATIASFYINAPELNKINNSSLLIRSSSKKEVIEHLNEFYNTFNNYDFQRLNSLINDYTKDNTLNMDKLIDVNEQTYTSNWLRFNFLLKWPYKLKDTDYEEIKECLIKIDKKRKKAKTVYQSMAVDRMQENFLCIFNKLNLVIDWNTMNSLFINNYISKDIFSEVFTKTIEKKRNSVLFDDKKVEINNSIKNNFLFGYQPAYEKDKWEEIRTYYLHIKKQNYLNDFDDKINEALPLIIEHDKKIKNLKSEKVINQTQEYITQILSALIADAKLVIEHCEMQATKELKVMAKYKKLSNA